MDDSATQIEAVTLVLDVLNAFGTLGALVYMVRYLMQDLQREKTEHADTRKEYRDDLREIAGMRRSLSSNPANPQWNSEN
jgi:hypothetical protein